MKKKIVFIVLSVCMVLLAGGLHNAIAADTAKTTSKKNTVEESADSIKAKLDVVGRKLVQNAATTVMPNERAKAVVADGAEFVANYVDIDTESLTTEVRASSGAGGKYIGVIKYLENHYECRAKTKADALRAPCTLIKSRRMNELIRYDGKWVY